MIKSENQLPLSDHSFDEKGWYQKSLLNSTRGKSYQDEESGLQDKLLTVKNLSVDFINHKERVQVLKNISFHLKKGQSLGLAGRSGSGKTILAFSIMRLLSSPPAVWSGQIFFKNRDLLKLPDRELEKIRGHRISMVFQNPMTSLNPVLTVGNQITELLRQKMSRKESWERAIHLMDIMGIEDPEIKVKSYPFEMSGGQRQRVMMAIAMACEPELLIADEPTTALDGVSQKQIMELIIRLQRQNNMAVLFITHNLELMKNFTDEMMVLSDGQIIEKTKDQNLFKSLLEGQIIEETEDKKLSETQTVEKSENQKLFKNLNDNRAKIQKDSKLSGSSGKNQSGNLNPSGLKTHGVSLSNPAPADQLSSKPIGFESSWNFPLKKHESPNKINLNNKGEPSLLEIKNLVVAYPIKSGFFRRVSHWKKAVDGVSLSLQRGRTLGLVGPSGSGKTSLGLSIVQLTKPLSGQIFYKGQDLGSLDSKQILKIRPKIQIIFQDPDSSLNPRHTIGSAIMEPMLIHKKLLHKNRGEGWIRGFRQKKIYYRKVLDKTIFLMEKVGLGSEFFNRYPHQISGGQCQRVCLARVLGLNPEFIIFDEALSSLDRPIQLQMLDLMINIRREMKLTFIFISHDLTVIQKISGQIATMDQGKIISIAENHQGS